jgi:hypothetical protein
VWHAPYARDTQERIWFERWIKEGYSLRQLADQSGWSQSKLKRIKAFWLDQLPPPSQVAWSEQAYAIFDGTYFHHTACLMVLYAQGRVSASLFTVKEDYLPALAWFTELKASGFQPKAITLDGNPHIIHALREVWPEVRIQRCLYHLKHQAEMWLRRPPKRAIAKDLKYVLQPLCHMTTHEEKDRFWTNFNTWKETYQLEIAQLKSKDKSEGDIIRAYRSIEHAAGDMFHYLDDPNISPTTNGLEGYFSHLKTRYRGHAGLRPHHLAHYLAWYIFFATKTSTS